MSQKNRGRIISCDGEGCDAEAVLPVGLQTTLGGTTCGDVNGPDGWLFYRSSNSWLHYCPDCSKKRVLNLLQRNGI